MNIITQRCGACGNKGMLLDVDALGYVRYRELGEDPRVVLPDLDEAQLGLLMYGVHEHCAYLWRGGVTFERKANDD